jgi:hypothetical protein
MALWSLQDNLVNESHVKGTQAVNRDDYPVILETLELTPLLPPKLKKIELTTITVESCGRGSV